MGVTHTLSSRISPDALSGCAEVGAPFLPSLHSPRPGGAWWLWTEQTS